MADSSTHADACGCCEDPYPVLPEEVKNRPGLQEVRYRIGTFATFQQELVDAVLAARLRAAAQSSGELPGFLATAQSDVRDDYGLAILDLWAYLGDILTFYQERIINEAFIRTAKQQESIEWLAKLLDYHPKPGVSAAALIAFRTEQGKNAIIPAGLPVQSVPGPGEKPQKFETMSELVANDKLTRVRIYAEPAALTDAVTITRLTVLDPLGQLAPDDQLLFWKENEFAIERKIKAIHQVDWRREIELDLPFTSPSSVANQLSWKLSRWSRKFRLFGHNVPPYFMAFEVADPSKLKGTSYEYGDGVTDDGKVLLDAAYEVRNQTTLLILDGTRPLKAAVTSVSLGRASAFGKDAESPTYSPFLSDTVTQLRLITKPDPEDNPGVEPMPLPDLPNWRSDRTLIYEFMGEPIQVWPHIAAAGQNPTNELFLNAGELGISAIEPAALRKKKEDELKEALLGRQIILSDHFGTAVVNQVTAVEVKSLSGVSHFTLTLADNVNLPKDLANAPKDEVALDAASIVLLGNIVAATHGERAAIEVLGSGDGEQPFQTFAVRKKPLTHLTAPGTLRGERSTLDVRVNKVLWHEVPSFYEQPADAQVYVTFDDAEGTTYVRFGDGVTGARLPTGRNNIEASYRYGTGSAGNLRAHTLSTLLRRPVGLSGASNPLPASGGMERESREQTRRNAPGTVRTFGRIVSVRDMEDAALEFRGIAKARVVTNPHDSRQLLLIVAGEDGADATPLLSSLLQDLDARRDSLLPLRIESFHAAPLAIEVKIGIDSRYVTADVKAAAKQAIRDLLQFDNLQPGQQIYRSNLSTAVQKVPGVISVDVDKLQRDDDDPPRPLRILPCEIATLKEDRLLVKEAGETT
jgi:uncharacterized phage protein gp47/JayE